MTQNSRHGSYDAVLCDLLTAVLDSWKVWNAVAGDEEAGMIWRHEYLELTYGQGDYAPYEEIVAQAAENVGLSRDLANDLAAHWTDLEPWPEAPVVLAKIARDRPVGAVTNCSESLGYTAAAQIHVNFSTVVTAERAGAYKPRAAAYQLALDELGLPAHRVLFVAGSRFDLIGAGGVGMPVWWHNRIGMSPAANAPALVGEGNSLTPLLAVLGIEGVSAPSGVNSLSAGSAPHDDHHATPER